MSAAAVEEKVGDGIGGRLRGKLKGVAVVGGEIALDGQRAAIRGDSEPVICWASSGMRGIERLGKLEIAGAGIATCARHCVGGAASSGCGAGERGRTESGDAFIDGHGVFVVEVMEGLVVIDADLAKGAEESLGGGDGEDDVGVERLHQNAVVDQIGLRPPGQAERRCDRSR